ncbi:hypothetical protein [Sphingomonas quercus]|uniref:Tryptophan-rich sensory protein n=1 Tax=Sphingomonas quercus TaxID=2842451 RepID=A0ABS6BL05_9SPHN|nr:hypothetical protein [Sphingomonas quercus]MBU3078980.1 hypothetical protein [Sphingomonas quercus]
MASPLSRLAPLILALFQIVAPLLPRLGIGLPIGDQSDAVRNLITPAGWAFAIWGPLYAGTIVFAVYQALPGQRDNALVAAIRWPAAAAFLGNGLWAAYTQLHGLGAISSGIIVGTLACLLVINRLFARWPERLHAAERWCVFLPLSALAGWITAATIANFAATLRFYEVAVTPPLAATMLIAGAVGAAVLLVQWRGNPPYGLLFLWALAAIFAAGGQASAIVAAAAAIAAILVLAAMAIGRRSAVAP